MIIDNLSIKAFCFIYCCKPLQWNFSHCMKYQNYNTCIFLAFRNYAWCCSFYLHLGWCTRARSTAWRDLGLTPWTLLCWSGSVVWQRDSYTCTGNTQSHKCSVFIQQTIQNVYYSIVLYDLPKQTVFRTIKSNADP